jgi:hypothetical protein
MYSPSKFGRELHRTKIASFVSCGIAFRVFSATHLFVSVIFISRVFRNAQKENQLDPRTRWQIRGLIMVAIEASVLYPAILLNVLKARSKSSAERTTVSGPSIAVQETWLTPITSSLTPYTMVSSIFLSRLILI